MNEATNNSAQVRGHPRRPRGSQSGRVKRRDESFQAWAEEPLCTDSPDHFQTIKRMLAPDWAQKVLVIIVPNRHRLCLKAFFAPFVPARLTAPGSPRMVSGQHRKITPALGTNQIAGFRGFHSFSRLEKNKKWY